MNVALALGLGLAAGAVGTVVLTLSETLEQRLTRRPASTVPGQVGASLSGKGGDEAAADRLNTPIHWIHGITMGAVRGALGLTGLGAVPATAVFYVLVWGGDVLLYRTLGIAPWPSGGRQSRGEWVLSCDDTRPEVWVRARPGW